eukprot:366450-Chlamydomonas_euryale.AAC.26
MLGSTSLDVPLSPPPPPPTKNTRTTTATATTTTTTATTSTTTITTAATPAQISMVVMYPLAIQHVQEMVPWAHAGHESVLTTAYWCSGVLSLSFIASCLLYLVREQVVELWGCGRKFARRFGSCGRDVRGAVGLSEEKRGHHPMSVVVAVVVVAVAVAKVQGEVEEQAIAVVTAAIEAAVWGVEVGHRRDNACVTGAASLGLA